MAFFHTVPGWQYKPESFYARYALWVLHYGLSVKNENGQTMWDVLMEHWAPVETDGEFILSLLAGFEEFEQEGVTTTAEDAEPRRDLA